MDTQTIEHRAERRWNSEAHRPWTRWYDEAVPLDVAVPNQPLPYFLAANAAAYPDRPAIRFLGRVMVYRDLDLAVNRFANALLGLGVRYGDRVGLLLPNCPQMVIAFYGALRAGATPVPTSPLSAESELLQTWDNAGVRAVVTLSSFYRRVEGIRHQIASLDHVIVTNIKEYFPPITSMLFTVAKEGPEGHRVRLARDGKTHRLQRLLARATATDPRVDVRGDDFALLQPTGGTTGTPKLAMLTHRNLLANVTQIRSWFGNLVDPVGPDVVLGVAPLFHIYGISTVLNYSLVYGDTMILQPRFVLRDVLRSLDRDRPDFFPGVPTMYMAINMAPHLDRYHLTSLKAAISGAAPLPVEVQARFEHLTGAKLVEGYGLTEAGPVTHCSPLLGKRKPGSIGVPIPGTDAAVFDQETGTHRLPTGEIGELAVRGPQVMQGYWHNQAETVRVLRGGWLFTGDLATMDEEGFFFIVDRKKDVIISGGMKVYPREVEEALYRHPAVHKVVAVGIPDEKWGETVKVFVVLKTGQTATEKELRDLCRTQVARYKVPKHVEFRSALPENLVGKVLRRKLREEEAADATGAA